MDRNPATLIAFGGPAIDQDRAVVELAERYECWNLKQFAFEQFIETIKAKIPPVNLNVLRNYVAATDDSQFGVTEHRFKTSAWGLLIPESVPDAIASGNSEALFLVNLYSPTFLYPVFTASDFGIMGANRRGPL